MTPDSKIQTRVRKGFWSPRNSVFVAIGWSLLIWVLLSIPGSNMPSSQIWAYDKVGHTGLFFVLSLLWLNAVREKSTRVVAGVIVAGILLGPLSEVYQGLLPIGRMADPYDAIADISGILLGTTLWYILSRVKNLHTGGNAGEKMGNKTGED